MAERSHEFGDLVRIGADHNSTMNASEVCRIDFDTDDGTKAIVVMRLASVERIVADLVHDMNDPLSERERLGSWESLGDGKYGDWRDRCSGTGGNYGE